MRTLLAPLLALAGFALYFVASTRFAVWRKVPWEYLAVSAAGAALGVWQLAAHPGPASALAAALAVGLAGFFAWFVLAFSMYGPREDRPRVGEAFPDFALPTSSGGTFALADARGRTLVVLCYRGDW